MPYIHLIQYTTIFTITPDISLWGFIKKVMCIMQEGDKIGIDQSVYIATSW